MKRKIISVVVLAVVLVLALLIHLFGAQTGTFGFLVEHLYPGLIRSESWLSVVSHPDQYDAYSGYGILEERGSDIGIPIALEHIHSDDAYLWLNAATYLGSRNRHEAIPYLIKSIQHTAWRSTDERVAMLERLTGQAFGNDFQKWREWYLSENPEVVPSWDDSLGHSPRVDGNANNPSHHTAESRAGARLPPAGER